MGQAEISVIVTTYNKERELALVLEGFRHQSFRDFELIVADDGSGEATRQVIEEARIRADHPIIHSWQEDKGFRAARSRNLAINKAQGKLIVMVDGDCVPLPDYLLAQRKTFKDACYLAGERYLLSQEEAAHIDHESIESGRCFQNIPERELKRVKSIRVKNRFYRALHLKVRPKVMTCNFAVSRADLQRINGFDERYVGWGHEDTDIGRRLRLSGIKSANALSDGCVLHLWHKTESSFAGRVRDCANADYFDRGFFLKSCRQGLVERSFNQLSITVQSSSKVLTQRAQKIFEAGQQPQPEVAILLIRAEDQGRLDCKGFPSRVDVPVLVLERGALESAQNLPAQLLKKTGLLLSQGEAALSGFSGMSQTLEGDSFDDKSLEEIRARLEELI